MKNSEDNESMEQKFYEICSKVPLDMMCQALATRSEECLITAVESFSAEKLKRCYVVKKGEPFKLKYHARILKHAVAEGEEEEDRDNFGLQIPPPRF